MNHRVALLGTSPERHGRRCTTGVPELRCPLRMYPAKVLPVCSLAPDADFRHGVVPPTLRRPAQVRHPVLLKLIG
jgi:hypothetical protein